MFFTRLKHFSVVVLAALGLASHQAQSAALAVRGGSFGYGADLDFNVYKSLNLRLGYNTFNLDRTLEDTDVTYDGKLKIGAASAIFDWHVFNGGFRLSAGMVQKGPEITVVGKPASNQTYEFNGQTYSSAQIGSVTGKVKIGDSAAPIFGIGWGNTVDEEDRITFLLDIAAIRTGTPKVELNATCNAAIPVTSGNANCSTFTNNFAAEKAELEDSAKDFQWYPVIALGIAVRF